ncbi:hypothetical protein F5Y15DRAFT_381385 [Xylariaceae sp. FL0016]|nr:hypothetical protein F5Y15DRAFT_381385 [Xylariaceae sp. FL0016]
MENYPGRQGGGVFRHVLWALLPSFCRWLVGLLGLLALSFSSAVQCSPMSPTRQAQRLANGSAPVLDDEGVDDRPTVPSVRPFILW